MIHEVSVTFTETVTRRYAFDLDIEDGVDVSTLECSDIHEMLDRQNAWDQPDGPAWLGGDIENRDVDAFEVTA
jgi:hypothetical protein